MCLLRKKILVFFEVLIFMYTKAHSFIYPDISLVLYRELRLTAQPRELRLYLVTTLDRYSIIKVVIKCNCFISLLRLAALRLKILMKE